MNQQNTEKEPSISLFQIIGSILSSFFGVQSSKKRTRDFSTGRAKHFVLVGIFMTFVCCAVLAVVVKLALPN